MRDNRKIGKNLRKVIGDLRFASIDAASKSLNITAQSLRSKCNGERSVSLDDVVYFAQAWDCDPVWLFARLIATDSSQSVIVAAISAKTQLPRNVVLNRLGALATKLGISVKECAVLVLKEQVYI